jgi:hypothetical protein
MSKLSLFSHGRQIAHFRTSVLPNESSTGFPASQDGDFMIYDEPAFPEWRVLGIAPHVADKILNHQAGTISGVAAVYQRHDFLAERREALETWVPILGRSSETKTLLFESLLDQFCCMSLAGLCGNPIFPS